MTAHASIEGQRPADKSAQGQYPFNPKSAARDCREALECGGLTFAFPTSRPSSIPKGLRPPAQGCRVREATLGGPAKIVINPNGVASRLAIKAATPLGLFSVESFSQGSSFLATLGWRSESLWDSHLVTQMMWTMERSTSRIPKAGAMLHERLQGMNNYQSHALGAQERSSE